VTAISDGYCLDTHVLIKYCRSCQLWNQRKDHPGYEAWKANHACLLNHEKSSGAMEGVGAVEIFSRSLPLYDIIYKYYLGMETHPHFEM